MAESRAWAPSNNELQRTRPALRDGTSPLNSVLYGRASRTPGYLGNGGGVEAGSGLALQSGGVGQGPCRAGGRWRRAAAWRRVMTLAR
jgi:hypothetical protein